MKKRYGWLWAGIALLGLLGLLTERFFKKEFIALTRGDDVAAWYGVQEWFSPEPAQIEQVVRDFAASGDAKKLAFAAILGQTLEEKSEHALPQETLDNWRKMALEKAAQGDVLLLNMLATYGLAKSDSAKAVRDEAILRWQQAEPDNLAPLLYQQTLGMQELLEQAKTRHYYQEYNYAISRWMYQTLLQQLPKQQKAITSEVLGIEAAVALPNIKPLADFCKKNLPEQSSENRRLCQSIAQKLREKSSDAVMRVVGIAILQSLLEQDVEKNMLANERAHIRWLLEQEGKHLKGVRIYERYWQRLQDETINSKLQEIEDFLQKEGLPLKATESNT